MPPETNPRYIDSLTALRGIAALLVVVFHYDGIMGHLVPHDWTRFVARGYLWVDFFFVLSGFVICHVYGPWFTDRVTRPAWQSYVAARFARLYPLHLFSLLLLVALAWAMQSFWPDVARLSKLHRMLDPATLPAHLLLGHAMGMTDRLTWNYVSWSIAAEWWTYLIAVGLFPLLNRGRRWRAWLAACVCLVALYLLAARAGRGRLNVSSDYGYLRCLFEFTIGICVYRAYRVGAGASLLGRDASFVALSALVIGLLHGAPHDLLLVPAFALLILGAAYNQGRARWFLNLAPLRFLGDISYSVYMVHVFWMTVLWLGFVHWAHKPAKFGLSLPVLYLWLFVLLAVLLPSAALTYRYAELPARHLLRRRRGTSSAA